MREPLFESLKRKVLFRFGHGQSENWTIGDAIEGLQGFGSTGSGKTSGIGRTLAVEFLNNGFGGLVLTAKPDDLDEWRKYFAASKRSLSDITVIEPAGSFPEGRQWPPAFTQRVRIARAVNLLQYELIAGGGLTANVTNLITNAMSYGGPSVSKNEPYWDETLREMLTHAIDLQTLATGKVKLAGLVALVRSAPQSAGEVKSATWRAHSELWQLVRAANKWAMTPVARRQHHARILDLEQTVHYWLHDFARLSDRTRSIIVSSFTAKASGLLRSPLRELFCDQTEADADPTQSHNGRVLILHLPVKLYGEVGRFAQILYKTIWQRATERRIQKISTSNDWKPVFLWADEAQYFVSPEDSLYQMTARSAFAATVYLTQNISNYYAMMTGNDARASVDSFLGNLQTKIFHANGDPATNEWAERLFGEDLREFVENPLSGPGGSSSLSPHPLVPAVKFTTLKKGGGRDRKVAAYIFQAGRPRVPDRLDPEARRYYHEFEQLE